ncbi:MAG TPA: DUF5916 domain-containing protein [Gemmatimonadales bacterium]|jgi:hypothetical protein|nr:DUF5916 domain-containing protein [Gemmatimonadales bacterium]
MSVTILLALAALQDSTPVHRGRASELRVRPPRLEASITVDGQLTEPVWTQAARLIEFSQYQPVDGRPAAEPTEVLIWYAPDAIYFGIRARELHGDVIRATRANRDNITSEDNVQILLDTFNSHRLAFLFGVNPLGVQQDGTRSDQFGGGAGGRSATGGGDREINFLEGNVDLNPDYAFESRGRLVEGGYEIEIRIPFKSLRYQDRAVQSWGINVLRRVQHSGFQDSWTPARRGSASFLSQSGSLEDLHDLKRGLVLELTPTATGRLDGATAAAPGTGWKYAEAGELGADVRWGIRQNLTLNGTWNPDFSQVEADVGQVLLNERFALFYPEKRPFFLEGLELFDTPSQLIYTRTIVAPRAGLKLAGKLGRTQVATLSAADDQAYSWSAGHRPWFGAARLRTDLGGNSTVGAVLTTREDDGDYSRLAGADLRIYHSKLYYVELQAAQSWTDSLAGHRSGPLLTAAWDRTGRAWGFHYSVRAVGPGFKAATGFVNRTGIIDGSIHNRLSFYGRPGALLETWTTFFSIARIWNYSSPGDGAIEGNESVNPSARLRGGWQLSGTFGRSFFSYDPALYAGYTVQNGIGGQPPVLPFDVPQPERNQWGASLRVTTPTYRRLTATASFAPGRVPIFREAAPGRSLRLDGSVDLRPTTALRATLQLSRLTLTRRRDGSRFSSETIPRVKLEYQISRPLFLRFVGQYSARAQAPLVDRAGHPILLNGSPVAAVSSNEFRMDWLFSYRPTPGTLVYLGYGSTLEEPEQFRFNRLSRTSDGFFGKLSYLFRM